MECGPTDGTNMADCDPPSNVEIDPDFEPQKRPRSCTWPLPRPDSGAGKSGTTDADVIPEEEDDEGGSAQNGGGAAGPEPGRGSVPQPAGVQRGPFREGAADGAPCSAQTPAAAPGSASQQLRKSSARRNAWGNYSYADLITQAIDASADKRLTLSQIYDWMVRSVPYFKDKGDTNSSAGWKNSIRHNLSLHSRFVKIQNEGTGKSSWWTVSADGGKGGKAPRRRAASMDNSKYMKGARGRAAKKKASAPEPDTCSLSRWTGSPASRSSDELDAWSDFRSRTDSGASSLSGRLSPILANLELDQVSGPGETPSSGPSGLSDLAETMTLSDGLTDHLMDDLLDDISLASQQAPPGEEAGGTQGAAPFGFPPIGLRPAPMQTIQENKQTSFCDVLLTQSDPLMSQTSAAIALQNSRRVALLLRKDPAPPGAAHSPALPVSDAAHKNAKQPHLKSPGKMGAVQLGPGLTGPGLTGPGLTGPGLTGPDLDLDVFNGGLDCDVDSIIRNELMEADCLDLSFSTQTSHSWVPS